MSTAVHEASHVAAAVMLGRTVDHVSITVGHTFPGETLGYARIPIGERVECSQIPVCVIGYMSEDIPGWPPPFERAADEELEALGIVVGYLGLTEEQYDDLVQIARDMLTDPDFLRVRDALARCLTAVPRIVREDIEALCRATRTPVPQHQEQPCST